jgi:hypothetical protein
VRRPGEAEPTTTVEIVKFRLRVSLPARTKFVFVSTRSFINTMESQRYDRREGLLGADHAAESTRVFLKHLNATVKVEEVVS